MHSEDAETARMNSLASHFFEHWKCASQPHGAALVAAWDNCPLYNELAFESSESVLAITATALGLRSYRANYYYRDSVLYAERDLVPSPPRPPGEVWLRRVRVHFEHEHKFEPKLFTETSQLLLTDCDLRVLVSYPGGEDARKQVMEMLHGVISGSDRSDGFSAAASFLFIAGWKDIPANCVKWTGYIYRVNAWQTL